MRPGNFIPEPSLLAPFVPLSFLASSAFAQDNGGKNDNSDSSNKDAAASDDGAPTDLPDPTKPPSPDNTEDTTSAKDEKSSEDKKDDSSSKEETKDEKSTDSSSDKSKDKETTSSESTEEETTSTSSSETTEETKSSEATSTSSGGGGGGGLTDAPTLTRGFGIPTYPAAAVPPTINAPFMQHSTAPDGTVFIAVGAILGALGLGLLLWRVISGILLHRSVERAAMAQHDANAKSGFGASTTPFYNYTDNTSNMSLSGGAAMGGSVPGRGVRRTNRGATPSANPSTSQLFFSPTAANPGQPGHRGSSFLPSGFYAAGNNPSSANQTNSISLTNLRPDSRGHGANQSRHTLDRSPPDSPAGTHARRDMSSSSLNLYQPPGDNRAPSAYLEDLLADDPNALPPPHMPPSSGLRHSTNGGYNSPGGRF